jgi:hypothetical protein
MAVALDLGASVRCFELDNNSFLKARYAHQTVQVSMPDEDERKTNSKAVMTALLAPLKALYATQPQDFDLVILDVGANLDGTLAHAMVNADLDRRITAADRRTAIVVPVLPDDDSIRAAARTVARLTTALPSAVPFLVQFGHQTYAPVGPEAKSAFAEYLQPILQNGRNLRVPEIDREDLAVFARAEMPLEDFIKADPDEVAKRLDINELLFSDTHAVFKRLANTLGQEVPRLFGFP